MAIQQLDIRPQEWFNQIYSELVNNEIVNTPYNKDYSSKFFFFKKRKWIKEYKRKDGYGFLDYAVYTDNNWNKEFFLTRRQSDNAYVIFDWDLNQVLEISEWWICDRFYSVLWWGESRYDNWTVSSSDATHITDNSKNWSNNELAGYYVYIDDWTGAWQLRQILSNTSDTIEVSWWSANPWSWASYVIYTSLVDNIVVPYNNWAYIFDWEQWYDSAVFSWYKIKWMEVWNSRLWYATGNQIIYSDEWDYYFSPAGNELFISNLDINNLYWFWNYLFVTTPKSIWVVYKGFSTTDWTPFFIIKEGVSQVWVKNRFGIWRYRDVLYFVSSDLRLYSLGVTMLGEETVFKFQDNWTLPSNFIEKYYDKDIKLYSDINYLYLFCIDGGKTKEIYYNDLYKGWLNNEYMVKINSKKLLLSQEYVLWDWFVWTREWYKDLDATYWQKIRCVVGEPDIFMWKDIKYVNILLWKSDYIQNWILTVTSHIWNKKVERKIDLARTWYISDMWDIIENTYWSTLIWYPLFGWDLGYLSEYISDIDIIQVWLNMTWQLIEFTIDTGEWDNWIFYGGMMVYYNLLNPKLKYYRNII